MNYVLDKESSKKFLYDLTHIDKESEERRLNFLKECQKINLIINEDGSFSASFDDNFIDINEIINILEGHKNENLG